MFWRSVIDGMPTVTVASELSVSTAAVRQARSRVLRRLREEKADLDP
jgi:RNA polymerase sigma-70 factor (ECF subfamily)